jgi:hypothetical protein
MQSASAEHLRAFDTLSIPGPGARQICNCGNLPGPDRAQRDETDTNCQPWPGFLAARKEEADFRSVHAKYFSFINQPVRRFTKRFPLLLRWNRL